ncbi:hypothetical protein BBP40_002960 [Aspergillus hancockii]|nr:hypothetical protein BBP40_002960 [Aspergillus hancockii]
MPRSLYSCWADHPFTLTSDGISPDIIVLDYGVEVQGYPSFTVKSLDGDTSRFEMSYSETRDILDSYMSDGPLTLSAAMDTYRVNRYDAITLGAHTNSLIQGGLRYQKLNLSSGGRVELTAVGILPTIDTTPIDQLPGSFNCSDLELTRIWQVGARTVQMNELPAKSIPEFWRITDQGAFVESVSPQPWMGSDTAQLLMQYDLDFSVKPVRGGFGFTVLSDTLGNGIYVLVDLTHQSVSAYEGATDIGSTLLAHASLNTFLPLGRWYDVTAEVNMTHIDILLSGQKVLSFSQQSRFAGSFGLGTPFGHAAYFQNVSLVANGQTMYSSSLKDRSVLLDFILGTNPLPVTVDGARRDRIAYAGDLDIAAGSSFASTYGQEYLNGTIHLLGSSQMLPGFFSPTVKIQESPRAEDIQANITGLIGYSFSLVTAMAQYYQMTGEERFPHQWADRITRFLEWVDNQTVPVHSNHTSLRLLNISDPTFGGDWNYYDPAQSGFVTKFNTLYAYTLQEAIPLLSDAEIDTTPYKSRLGNLKQAINQYLWNPSLHAYGLSLSNPHVIPQDANAFAILANIPTNQQHNSTRRLNSTHPSTTTTLQTLKHHLFAPNGALSFSPNSINYTIAQKISPFSSGYHLRAAFHANDTATARHLLHTLWSPMADPTHTSYTGCFWEVLNRDGTPGLSKSTSLCHAWSAGPTADLTRYVLGIRATKPGFAEWMVAPQTIGLEWAEGRQKTPYGFVEVFWKVEGGLMGMVVKGPVGTVGRVYLPEPGVEGRAFEVEVLGGETQTVAMGGDGSLVIPGGVEVSLRQRWTS